MRTYLFLYFPRALLCYDGIRKKKKRVATFGVVRNFCVSVVWRVTVIVVVPRPAVVVILVVSVMIVIVPVVVGSGVASRVAWI